MSDLTVILLCGLSYVIGGMFGMGTLMMMRQAKRADRLEAVSGC